MREEDISGDDPRWLGAEPLDLGAPTDPGRRSDLIRALDEYDALLGMFSTEGWELFDSLLAVNERAAELALTRPRGGLQDLNEIYAVRHRLDILRWLRAMPADVKEKRDNAHEELAQIPDEEEADAARR
jgi:hypothetical protein